MARNFPSALRATALLACSLVGAAAFAAVHLPPIFSDHMVLQRGAPLQIWGTAEPGEAVTVSLASASATARADAGGHWKLQLAAMPAGGPFEMTAKASNRIVVHDVLIGEVWLSGAENASAEIAQSANPQLRMFTVKKKTSLEPVAEAAGDWQLAGPETSGRFSAVGYYFARKLVAELNVPVGIIHTSWGGTPAEAWASMSSLKEKPELAEMATRQIDALRGLPQLQQDYLAALAKWEQTYDAKDRGNSGFAAGWAKPDADLSQWKAVKLPNKAADIGMKSGGAVWFRRDVEIPDPSVNNHWSFYAGQVFESDVLYVNGVQVGTSGTNPLDSSFPWRSADVPKELLHAGKNTVAIRAFFHTPAAGRFGADGMGLLGSKSSILKGEWLSRVEFELPAVDEAGECGR